MLEHLETVPIERPASQLGFRLPVQWVCRPDHRFRGYAGQVAAGMVAPGDEIIVLPSGARSRVDRIVTADGDLKRAKTGDAVNLTLTDDIDISRGDVIAASAAPPQVADQLAAHILWMNDQALLPGRPYRLKLATSTVNAQVTEIKYKIDVNSQDHLAAKRLELN
jgi:bifunctional enzyme CysN/CysC